jgi:hypothetical protein
MNNKTKIKKKKKKRNVELKTHPVEKEVKEDE